MHSATRDRTDLADDVEIAAAETIAYGSRPGRRTPRQMRRRDDARRTLLERARPSISAVVNDAYRNRRRTGIDRDDLEQEAFEAVWQATLTWKPESYPSWGAYAGSASRRRLAEVLDVDESGRYVTRATSRLLRHARGARAAAERRGEIAGVDDMLTAVAAASRDRAENRGADPDEVMARNGEAASIDKDLRGLLGEGTPLRLDAEVDTGDSTATTFSEIISAADRFGQGALVEALGDLLNAIPDEDVETLLEKGRGGEAAKQRAIAHLASPHLQWAWAGPLNFIDGSVDG